MKHRYASGAFPRQLGVTVLAILLASWPAALNAAVYPLDLAPLLMEGDQATPFTHPVVYGTSSYDGQLYALDPVDLNGRIDRFFLRFNSSNRRLNGGTWYTSSGAIGFSGSETVDTASPQAQIWFTSGSNYQVLTGTILWYARGAADTYQCSFDFNDYALALRFIDNGAPGLDHGDVLEIVAIVVATGPDSVFGMTGDELLAATVAQPPDTPGSFSVNPADGSVLLDWEAVTSGFPVTYNAHRAPSAAGPFNAVAGGLTSTSYLDAQLTNGVTYHYNVEAVADGSVTSSPTATLPATPLPGLVRPSVDVQRNHVVVKPVGSNATVTVEVTTDLNGTAGSPGYQWEVVHKPAGSAVTVSPSLTAEDVDVSVDRIGRYALKLTVDNGAAFAVKTVGIRVLSPAPAVDVHPRILFGPDEVPLIRDRLATETVATQAYANVLSYAQTFYDGDAPFGDLKAGVAVDLTPYINYWNGSAWATGSAPNVAMYGRGDYQVYGPILSGAFVAMIENDPVKGAEAGTALATAAQQHALFYQQANIGAKLYHDADADLALAYDFAHPWMTEPQRDKVRNLIRAMTVGRNAFGYGQEPWEQSTNWPMLHDHLVICALGIEGETGYQAHVYDNNIVKLENYARRWGLYDSGWGHEGFTYLTFAQYWGLPSLMAATIRGENLLDPTGSNLPQWINCAFYSLAPWGVEVHATHDSPDPANGQYGWGRSQTQPMMKFLYHADGAYDIYFRNWDTLVADADKHLFTALFGIDPEVVPTERQDTDKRLTRFTPYRGLVNTRSDWSDDALRFDFECRGDLWALGHVHTDRNGFILLSHRRRWVVGTGRSYTENKHHATVLIDGLGQNMSEATGKTYWPSAPGRLVQYENHDDYVLAAGDAEFAYDFFRNYKGDTTGETFFDNSGGTYTWSDYVYDPDDIEPWMETTPVAMFQDTDYDLGIGNPVDKAFRTAVLVRGRYPFVVIVDDIDKDGTPHTYGWSAPVDDTLTLDSTSNTEALLRHGSDGAGDPRLLVRAIEADGNPSPIALGNPFGPYRRLTIARSDVVRPDFKVLLYPHRDGDPLPVTSLVSNRLTVTIGTQKHIIDFTPDPSGRTLVHVKSIVDFPTWISKPSFGLYGADRDPGADPDGDRVPSLWEYLFLYASTEFNPALPDAHVLRPWGSIETGGRFAINLRHADTLPTGYSILIEGSDDLGLSDPWTDLTGLLTRTGGPDSRGDGSSEYTYTQDQATGSGDKPFLRAVIGAP